MSCFILLVTKFPKNCGQRDIVFALALTSMAVAYLTTVYAVRKVVSAVRSRKHLDWLKW